MSNLTSPLEGATATGPLGRATEAPASGMITLRGALDGAPMAAVVQAMGGAGIPGQRQITGQGAVQAAWMSPDELLVLCPLAEVKSMLKQGTEAAQGQHITLADVSDARAVMDLSGAGWRDALAKLTPGDLHPKAFAMGEVRRSRLAQVPVAYWMTTEEAVRLVVFRSVAQYAFDILAEAIQTPVAHLSPVG